MPIRLAVRATRQAISPRLAIRILVNTSAKSRVDEVESQSCPDQREREKPGQEHREAVHNLVVRAVDARVPVTQRHIDPGERDVRRIGKLRYMDDEYRNEEQHRRLELVAE